MAKFDYKKQAQNLGKAIDIALLAVQKFPLEDLDEEGLDFFREFYLKAKDNALNPESKYANKISLSYLKLEVFHFFEYDAGDAVDFFWKEIRKEKLPYSKGNLLKKILKRGKMKNEVEYEFVKGIFDGPYMKEGLINEKQIELLNKIFIEYEEKY